MKAGTPSLPPSKLGMPFSSSETTLTCQFGNVHLQGKTRGQEGEGWNRGLSEPGSICVHPL